MLWKRITKQKKYHYIVQQSCQSLWRVHPLWRVQSDSLSHNIHSDICFFQLILIIKKLENLKREENETGTPETPESFVPQNITETFWPFYTFKLMIDHWFTGAAFMYPAVLLPLLKTKAADQPVCVRAWQILIHSPINRCLRFECCILLRNFGPWALKLRKS